MRTGIQNNGRRFYLRQDNDGDTFLGFGRESSSMARDLAYGGRVRMELRMWSYLFMRVMYSSTMDRHVRSPRKRASWRDFIVASRRVNLVCSRLEKMRIATSAATIEENTIVCSQNTIKIKLCYLVVKLACTGDQADSSRLTHLSACRSQSILHMETIVCSLYRYNNNATIVLSLPPRNWEG
jgi:hypothetical protein